MKSNLLLMASDILKGKGVLDKIISDNSKYYEINSYKKIGDLSPRLRLFYSDSFVDCAKNSKNFSKDFAKFHRCAIKYGYIGFSARKNNGIVDIKPGNTNLIKSYENLLTSKVIAQYGLSDNLKPVKVVAHVPNGNRLVGVLDKTAKNGYHIVVILGLSNYNGKPK